MPSYSRYPVTRRTTVRRPVMPRYPAVQRYGGSGAYKRYTTRRNVRGNGAYSVDNGPWANAGGFIGRSLGKAAFGRTAGDLGEWLGRRAFHYFIFNKFLNHIFTNLLPNWIIVLFQKLVKKNSNFFTSIVIYPKIMT